LPGLARISLGIENTENDIDRLILALDQIARKSEESGLVSKKAVSDFIEARFRKVYTNPGI
jgi:hypothetical protein